MPLMIGPRMPERLPTEFCIPTHVPAARAPENIWATAKTFRERDALAAPARQRKRAIGKARSEYAIPRMAIPTPNCETPSMQRRQAASERPERVHQSEKCPKLSAA